MILNHCIRKTIQYFTIVSLCDNVKIICADEITRLLQCLNICCGIKIWN